MSVVPELRQSLVKAAARQAAPGPRRSRRPRPAGVGLTLGAAIAVAVVGVVFLLSSGSSSPPVSHPPLAGRPAALLAAERLLAQVHLPPGAVAVTSDQSHPRQLGSPPQGVLPSGSVDVHRFFLMGGNPQAILNAIQHLNVKLETDGGSGVGEASAGASSGGGRSLPAFASQSDEISPLGRVRRELQMSVAIAHHGQSALRIDARAYWTPPRPAYTLIPPGTQTIEVRVTGASAGAVSHGLKTTTRLSADGDVALVVGFLNALPIAPAHGNPELTGQPCSKPQIRIDFLGAGGRMQARAVVHPPCGRIDLWTGHTRSVLTFEAPATGFKPQTLYRVLVLLVGVS